MWRTPYGPYQIVHPMMPRRVGGQVLTPAQFEEWKAAKSALLVSRDKIIDLNGAVNVFGAPLVADLEGKLAAAKARLAQDRAALAQAKADQLAAAERMAQIEQKGTYWISGRPGAPSKDGTENWYGTRITLQDKYGIDLDEPNTFLDRADLRAAYSRFAAFIGESIGVAGGSNRAGGTSAKRRKARTR